MTVKRSISIPDELEQGIKLYNKKNPFRKLNVSQIAQESLFQELSTDSEIKQFLESFKKGTSKPSQSKLTVGTDPVKTEYTFDCMECGEKFSSSSPKAKFCSGKCRTTFHRKKAK